MKNAAVEKAIEFAGGSQKSLAQKIGTAQSTICDWLNGNKRISPENVSKLVKATDGRVHAYEFRPDLPDLFPHPEQAA
jgi:DNA-binding transcriptional regulator YdaS (Cro superfamily)